VCYLSTCALKLCLGHRWKARIGELCLRLRRNYLPSPSPTHNLSCEVSTLHSPERQVQIQAPPKLACFRIIRKNWWRLTRYKLVQSQRYAGMRSRPSVLKLVKLTLDARASCRDIQNGDTLCCSTSTFVGDKTIKLQSKDGSSWAMPCWHPINFKVSQRQPSISEGPDIDAEAGSPEVDEEHIWAAITAFLGLFVMALPQLIGWQERQRCMQL
jgi:hypothetical protein